MIPVFNSFFFGSPGAPSSETRKTDSPKIIRFFYVGYTTRDVVIYAHFYPAAMGAGLQINLFHYQVSSCL
jgi:hypothetical protein